MGAPKKKPPHSTYVRRRVINIVAKEGNDVDSKLLQGFVRMLNEKASLGVDTEWIVGAMLERFKREAFVESLGLNGQFPFNPQDLRLSLNSTTPEPGESSAVGHADRGGEGQSLNAIAAATRPATEQPRAVQSEAEMQVVQAVIPPDVKRGWQVMS